jgi:hypothetical protein
MYKKHKIQEIVNNDEEKFVQQFFNFMRKNLQYVMQIPSSEINLDLGATVQQYFALSSADSALIGTRISIMWMTSRIPHLTH